MVLGERVSSFIFSMLLIGFMTSDGICSPLLEEMLTTLGMWSLGEDGDHRVDLHVFALLQRMSLISVMKW